MSLWVPDTIIAVLLNIGVFERPKDTQNHVYMACCSMATINLLPNNAIDFAHSLKYHHYIGLII